MLRKPLLAVAALLLAALLAACGGAPPAAGVTPPPPGATQPPPAAEATQPPAEAAPAGAAGGTLTIGVGAPPDSLNPGAAYIVEAGYILDAVYDMLYNLDLKNQPYPGLAREWSVAEDGRTWTFTLAEGATWHDGQPVTAEDVKFTFEMIAGFEAFGLYTDYLTQLDSVEAPDAATAVVTFAQPVANADEIFTEIPILPQHIWGEFADETAALEFENSEMIGSGPFRMAEYLPGEFTRLAAVKDHYATPPKIDELIFRVFGNGDAMVQALRTGEVAMIGVPSNTVVRSLQSDPNIKVEIGNGRDLTDIIFNIAEAENCPPEVGVCSGHPALKDVRVRQALAHATDKQALIDGVLLGLGVPGLSLVTPAQGDGFAAQLEDYAFDLERANQILDEAGYADGDGDGVREMPGDPANTLTFRYSYPSDQAGGNGQRHYELLREMWGQAGVALDLTPLDSDALTAICCPAFDFDVIDWGWEATADPASLLNIATTGQIASGVSETGYANPEYDQLYEEQLVTVDRARRVAIIHQMQEILLRDVPYIIPWYSQRVSAYRLDKFQGWVVEPDGLLELTHRLSLVNVSQVP